MNFWPLIGVAVVVLGFALKRNAVLVVVCAGVASALAAGMAIGDLLALLGNTFVGNRSLLLFTLTLPVIGLLEHYGLRERAQRWIAGFPNLSLARLLIGYLGVRQLLAMFGLIDLGGHAQTVRPLLAPMAESAAARGLRDAPALAGAAPPDVATTTNTTNTANGTGVALPDDERERVRALAAATDNIGRFFGEDVFLAFGAVLLIQGFYERNGIHLEPLAIALWSLPTAIAAFVIHALRLVIGERRRARASAAREAGA